MYLLCLLPLLFLHPLHLPILPHFLLLFLLPLPQFLDTRSPQTVLTLPLPERWFCLNMICVMLFLRSSSLLLLLLNTSSCSTSSSSFYSTSPPAPPPPPLPPPPSTPLLRCTCWQSSLAKKNYIFLRQPQKISSPVRSDDTCIITINN